MKKSILFTLLILTTIIVHAQRETLRLEETGYLHTGISAKDGKIILSQNPNLNNIIKKRINSNENTFPGWRVQIFFESGNTAMSESRKAKEKFLYRYGNSYGAYIIYEAPYFKLRVGDFRSKAEALYFKERISSNFPNSWVVPDIINYPETIN